jgi:hypothetical protein
VRRYNAPAQPANPRPSGSNPVESRHPNTRVVNQTT